MMQLIDDKFCKNNEILIESKITLSYFNTL